jgi:lipopolysaccharide export system protein LptA
LLHSEVFALQRKLVVSVLIGVLTLVAAVGVAQQVKRAQNAVVTAQTMEYDWGTNTVDFSGGTKLVLAGEHDATMTAPSMAVKLSPKADRVLSVVANGPVNFSLLTKPDESGTRRKIVATAKQQATYSDETQIIKLTGGATADLLPAEADAPAGEGLARAEAIHFTGQTITANLKTNKLTVDDANLTVETKAQ